MGDDRQDCSTQLRSKQFAGSLANGFDTTRWFSGCHLLDSWGISSERFLPMPQVGLAKFYLGLPITPWTNQSTALMASSDRTSPSATLTVPS
jgi:hypothetical protein